MSTNAFDAQAERFYSRRVARERDRFWSTLVTLAVLDCVAIFVLLVACGRSPVGTVTKIQLLPSGNYQVEVIAGYTSDSDAQSEIRYASHDVGPDTGCQVGERWPSCD